MIERDRYVTLFGPTVGDRIRLGDTNILIEVTEDRSRGQASGDEAVFGGGKVIRESMGQSRATRAEGALDLVITGAVILDYWGVIKADIGVRDGLIVGIGKAGNPDTMDGVDPVLVIGPSTEVLAANGTIVTAGAIDCHVHFICPQIVEAALGKRGRVDVEAYRRDLDAELAMLRAGLLRGDLPVGRMRRPRAPLRCPRR